MKHLALSLLLTSLCASAQPLFAQEREVSAVNSQSITTPDPAQHVRALALGLRNNDLGALLQSAVPPAQYQKLRQAFEQKRLEPTTEVERKEFARDLAKLTAPDAVDKFMLEIEPKLVEARPKAAGALLMGLGALQMAISTTDNKLTEEQRQALQSAFPGIQRWASSTDFLNSESLRQAMTLIANAARNTGVRSIDELKLMSFEQSLSKASVMLGAAKQALQIYGLDLNAIADSLRVETLSVEGTTARVRTTVTLFGAPISKDHELVLIDGRWYGKDAVVMISQEAKRHGSG
jgi:hypothetical protein